MPVDLQRRAALGLVLAIAAVATTGAACGKSAPPTNADGTRKVKLALNWVPEPEFGGFYAARDGGAYKAEKLDVEIQAGGPGVPVLQMVDSGKVDFGLVGADEVITGRAKGMDIVVLYATYQTSPQGLMTHEERGITTIAELLKSGTIGMEPGQPYAQFLKKKYGDFGAKVVPYNGDVANFVADKDFSQQCFVTSEPLAARKKGAKPKVFLIADEGFNPYVAVAVTRRKFAQDFPDIVKAFVAGTKNGWSAYLADPTAANAVMAKLNTSMDEATFKEVAEAQRSLVTGPDASGAAVGSMTKERWSELAGQLRTIGVVDKAVDIDFIF